MIARQTLILSRGRGGMTYELESTLDQSDLAGDHCYCLGGKAKCLIATHLRPHTLGCLCQACHAYEKSIAAYTWDINFLLFLCSLLHFPVN